MDRKQEDMQFLSLFGICQEACKIIFSWRKIFSQITLTLILPLSFIILAHIEVSDLLLSMIIHNFLITSGLFDFAYVTFLFIFSLYSTSAVVYTIACIYTGREVTFKKLMSIVPKVWKRLMLTFMCTFIVFLAYSIMGALLIINLSSTLLRYASTNFAFAAVVFIVYVLWIFYLVGIFYIIVVWHLASTVTVLEDTCGIRAMIKSKALMKGKMGVATIIFLMLYISGCLIQGVLKLLVDRGGRELSSLGMVNWVAYAIICLLLLSKLILFGLVIQTVIYLVYKSYHHENIDKSVLSDHLEVYVGDYVTLKAKDRC